METTTNTPQNTVSPEQPDLNDLQKLLTKAQSEWKHWIGTFIIALVLVLGISLYRTRTQSNEEQASRMLGEARSGQAIQAIIAQYPRTASATLALLQMAKIQYDSGDYVAALSSYTDFINRNPKHMMTVVAELGKIHCSEAMGQTADALSAFTAFAKQHPDHYLAPQALFGKARCLQRLDRYAEARAVYEDFIAAHPDSAWKKDIDEALRQLERDGRKASPVAVKTNP
jgi:TolA-binding protein